mgnify:CR=1 FL=1|jgi:hypothetical protein
MKKLIKLICIIIIISIIVYGFVYVEHPINNNDDIIYKNKYVDTIINNGVETFQ